MAQGDPVAAGITLGSSNMTFLLTAETGVIIENEERDISASFRNVFSASAGFDIGFVVYNWAANYSFTALINGTTGMAAIAPGYAMTTQNDLSAAASSATPTYNGVAKTSGGIFVQTVRISHAGEELRSISGSAVQRAGITS